MNPIVRILMERDGLAHNEANELLAECVTHVECGEDPEEILLEELGLEPDYLFDLLAFCR